MNPLHYVMHHGPRFSSLNATHIREWLIEHPQEGAVDVIRDLRKRGFLTEEHAAELVKEALKR